MVAGACSAPGPRLSPLPVSAGGVTLRRATAPSPHARSGDLLLSGGGLTATVGGTGRGERVVDPGGVTLALSGRARSGPAGILGGLRQGRAELPLEVVRVTPVTHGPRPSVVVEHRQRGGALLLSTSVALNPERGVLELDTRVTNPTRSRIGGLSFVDHGNWHGVAPFAPGVGEDGRGQVPWVARAERAGHRALVFQGELRQLEPSSDHVGPTGFFAASASFDLEPGGGRSFRRVLVVAEGSLATVAERAWTVRGDPLGTLGGTLRPAPRWATISAEDDRHRTILSTRSDARGRWSMPVPPGTYRVVLTAPGGIDRHPARVERGHATEVSLLAPVAGRLRLVATDEHDVPRPTRWTVWGEPPTANPELAGDPSVEGHFVFSASGEHSVDVPPGRYRLVATRGIEHGTVERSVAVEADRGASVRAVLARSSSAPGHVACDFHLHQAPSWDSQVSLEQRIDALLVEGVGFAVATDHNHVTDLRPALDASPHAAGLVTAVGVEITTRPWGHFNAFPLEPATPRPPHVDVTPVGIFDAVRAGTPGAVIQVNHPRMRHIGYFDLGGLDATTGAAHESFSFEFDTIEVFNGFDLPNLHVVERNLRDWYGLLSLGYRFVAVGNSDSHQRQRQWAGYPRTYVDVGDGVPVTPRAVAASLKAGRAFVTNGPLLHVRVGDATPGRTALAEGGKVRVTVAATGPSFVEVDRLEVVLDGSIIDTVRSTAGDLSPSGVTWTFDVSVSHDAWIVVVVRGEKTLDAVLPGVGARPFAFSNPVWIDVDGDGAYTPRRSRDAGADAASD